MGRLIINAPELSNEFRVTHVLTDGDKDIIRKEAQKWDKHTLSARLDVSIPTIVRYTRGIKCEGFGLSGGQPNLDCSNHELSGATTSMRW